MALNIKQTNLKKLVEKIRLRRSTKDYAGDPELLKHYQADAFIISYPKSGRTWLRIMLGKYLSCIYEYEFNIDQDISEISSKNKNIPYIAFVHDFSSNSSHKKRVRYLANNLPQNKAIYKNKKVVLLVRDLRDVVISYFFHCTQRDPIYSGTISQFIRDEQFGISKAVEFLNIWHKNRKIPTELIVVKYEDILNNPIGELLRVVHFLDLPVSQEAACSSVDFASFDNMKTLESSKDSNTGSEYLGIKQNSSNEAYKVRKGKACGFTDYLSAQDISYLTNYINSTLNPYYGYCFLWSKNLNEFT